MNENKTLVDRHKRRTPTGRISDVRAHWRRIRGVRPKAPILKGDGFDKHYQEGLDAAQMEVDRGVLSPETGERIPFSDQMLYSAAQEAEKKSRSLDPTVEAYYRAQADYFQELLQVREEQRKKVARVGGGFITNSDGRREWVSKNKDDATTWNWRGSGGVDRDELNTQIEETRKSLRDLHASSDFHYCDCGYVDPKEEEEIKRLNNKLQSLEAEQSIRKIEEHRRKTGMVPKGNVEKTYHPGYYVER